MAVLIRHRVTGMDTKKYDEISDQLRDVMKVAPGFVLHTAFVEDGNFMVSEVWETQAEHDKWFDENVMPHLPPDSVEQQVIELHHVLTP